MCRVARDCSETAALYETAYNESQRELRVEVGRRVRAEAEVDHLWGLLYRDGVNHAVRGRGRGRRLE